MQIEGLEAFRWADSSTSPLRPQRSNGRRCRMRKVQAEFGRAGPQITTVLESAFHASGRRAAELPCERASRFGLEKSLGDRESLHRLITLGFGGDGWVEHHRIPERWFRNHAQGDSK